MKKVFLGGTCNDSEWRNELIPMLDIDYFNPVVDDDSNKRPEKTIFCVLETDRNPAKDLSSWFGIPDKIHFDTGQLKSLNRVGQMVQLNGGQYFKTLEDVAKYLNE